MGLSDFIKSIDALSDLNEPDISRLVNHSQLSTYQNSEVIIKRGNIGRFLHIIYEGKVDVILTRMDGSRRVVACRGKGEILGEMSIMTGEPAIADVVSSAVCTIIKVPREIFSRIIAENPKTLSKFSKIITKRLLENEKDEQYHDLRKSAHGENDDPYDLNFSSSCDPMKILVLNSSSSSLRYSLFDATQDIPLCEGLVERIGTGKALHTIKGPRVKQGEMPDNIHDIHDIEDAFGVMVAAITDASSGAVKDLFEIDAVGHRITHGGDKFQNSVVIDDSVIESIQSYSLLAPLHNPFNLRGVMFMRNLLPAVPQVAVFDTAFHQTLPETAYVYALPHTICEKEKIRRYGFHGTNHHYVALSAATHLRRPLKELKIVSCHLGDGASVCAIDHGRSIDTSMGMTPLEGLIMGTRAGDIDIGAILHLLRSSAMNIDDVEKLLNEECGLLGISGKSSDLREILQGAEAGDAHCKMAISVFSYRVKKYIGAYIAALSGIDVLIFTGGIGEHSPEVRALTCQGLEIFGIHLSLDTNKEARSQRGMVYDVSEPGSNVRVIIVPADEERMIARETIHALGRLRTKDEIGTFKSMPIPLSISAHHVHLSRRDFESMFGKGRNLTRQFQLTQPGQFAAEETVNLIGPRGRIQNVRILGPFRKESQVEIARTEQFKLGLDAPIRDSGDIEGTPGIILEGEVGQIKLNKGVICAKRHIHSSPDEALALGLRDRDVVMVRVKSVRPLIFGDVLVRVHPDFKLDMHLDTDEANAAQIAEGISGYVESIQSRQYM